MKLLEHLRDNDTDGSASIVYMRDFFYFRNHMCITFELLCINLYEFIKNNKFQVLKRASTVPLHRAPMCITFEHLC